MSPCRMPEHASLQVFALSVAPHAQRALPVPSCPSDQRCISISQGAPSDILQVNHNTQMSFRQVLPVCVCVWGRGGMEQLYIVAVLPVVQVPPQLMLPRNNCCLPLHSYPWHDMLSCPGSTICVLRLPGFDVLSARVPAYCR